MVSLPTFKKFFFLKNSVKSGRLLGHRPDVGNFTNSGYMADYFEIYLDQLNSWCQNGAISHHRNDSELRCVLGRDCQVFKVTIEPRFVLGF